MHPAVNVERFVNGIKNTAEKHDLSVLHSPPLRFLIHHGLCLVCLPRASYSRNRRLIGIQRLLAIDKSRLPKNKDPKNITITERFCDAQISLVVIQGRYGFCFGVAITWLGCGLG